MISTGSQPVQQLTGRAREEICHLRLLDGSMVSMQQERAGCWIEQDGDQESLAAGDLASARGLVDLLRAVWPRDLEVLELARRVETSEN